MKFMHMIDRRRVKDSFGKHAHEYDNHALVQKRVVARFLEKLCTENVNPRNFLDVGTGSGMLLRSVRAVYGDIFAVGADLSIGMSRIARENLQAEVSTPIVTADADYLPFASGSFDMVVSTSTFQWVIDLSQAFMEAFRVLRPGGIFSFSLFGEETLHELRNSYQRALLSIDPGKDDPTHVFFSDVEVASALKKAGFTDTRITKEQDIELHSDVPALLRSLKRIGAGNASPITHHGLGGRMVMLDMMNRYREYYGNESGIPATYELIYATARKSLSPALKLNSLSVFE